eukprot:11164424-Lingulodinium_polyedra.AAC.1
MTATLMLARAVIKNLACVKVRGTNARVTPASVLAAPGGPVRTRRRAPRATSTAKTAMDGEECPS